MVRLPPFASMAAPTAASTSASGPGASRVRAPVVGSRSSHSSLVQDSSQSNRHCYGSANPPACAIPSAAAANMAW
jgi:hypothetical protein